MDRAGELPARLSGGERQRVAIARALVNRPRCCWPTSRPARWTPRAPPRSSTAADGCTTGQTILMVTHDREVAAGAQRIVRMRDGCVVEGADDDLGTEPAEPIVAPAGPLWVDALTGRRTRLARRADPGDTAFAGSGPPS